MNFYCYVLSNNSKIKNLEHIYQFNVGTIPSKISKPLNFVSKNEAINQCRELLYNSFIGEQKWRPNTNTHTGFYYKTNGSNVMLCDKFDDVAIWICVIDSKSLKVVGTIRLLIDEFDMTGYVNCPNKIKKVIIGKTHQFVECQRVVVSNKYRGSLLILYLYHCMLDYTLSANINKNMIIGTYTDMRLINFTSKLEGVTYDPTLSFKYDNSDELIANVIYSNMNLMLNSITKIFNSKL